MPIYNQSFDLSPELAKGLTKGTLKLFGGVVRQASDGQIVAHLKPIAESAAKEVAPRVAKAAKVHPVAAAGALAAVAVIAGGAYVINRQAKTIQRQRDFEDALVRYLLAMRDGRLSEGIVADLLARWTVIERTPRIEKRALRSKRFKEIASTVTAYTRTLADANHLELEPALQTEPKTLVELKPFLERQQRIIAAAPRDTR